MRRDFDKFDPFCDHMLVIDRTLHDEDGQPLVVGTYRMIREAYLDKIGGFYTASEYDISPMLAAWPASARYLELGRSASPPPIAAVRQRCSSCGAGLWLMWRGSPAICVRLCVIRRHGSQGTRVAIVLSASLSRHAAGRACARATRTLRRNESHAERRHRCEGGAARASPMIKGYLRAGLPHR